MGDFAAAAPEEDTGITAITALGKIAMTQEKHRENCVNALMRFSENYGPAILEERAKEVLEAIKQFQADAAPKPNTP